MRISRWRRHRARGIGVRDEIAIALDLADARARATRAYPLSAYLGCPRLYYDAEARVCKLVDAPRQIRALDDALAATKPLREGSARTVGEARTLDARRRERQSAQLTASAAVPAASRDRTAAAT